MSGKAKGVQARLKELNPGCLFSACGCHSLNLVGVHSVQCCPDVITFFGVTERLYVLFSCSPARWEMLKNLVPLSIQRNSTTKWSARHDSVKPIAVHYPFVIKALKRLLEFTNLELKARSEALALLKYMNSFKSVVLCTVWNTLLKHIHTANLFIQKKDCSLDTQLNNLMQLKEEMANVRNDWEGYYSKAKIAASRMDLKEKDFPASRRDCAAECAPPAEAFKRNVFYVAVDVHIVGVQKCITKLDECAEKFRFLWKFDEMSDAELLA